LPYKHEIRPAEGFAVLVGWGHTDHAESRRAMHAVVLDPAFKHGLGLLVDVRDLTAIPSAAEAQKFAAFLEEMLPRKIGRLGIVTRGSLSFGMGRLLASLVEMRTGAPMNVFDDVPPAISWLTGHRAQG
jgi:hypothetical protein